MGKPCVDLGHHGVPVVFQGMHHNFAMGAQQASQHGNHGRHGADHGPVLLAEGDARKEGRSGKFFEHGAVGPVRSMFMGVLRKHDTSQAGEKSPDVPKFGAAHHGEAAIMKVSASPGFPSFMERFKRMPQPLKPHA